MNANELAGFLNQQFESNSKNWLATNLADVVFIEDQDQPGEGTIATVSFWAKQGLIEYTETGQKHRTFIYGLLQEYKKSQPKYQTPNHAGTLGEEYSRSTAIFVGVCILLCILISVIGGLALGSFLFG